MSHSESEKEIFTFKELEDAYKHVKSGNKYSKGSNLYFSFLLEEEKGITIRKMNGLGLFLESKKDPSQYLKSLQEKINSGKYHMSPYTGIAIPKSNGKVRTLLVPKPEERIVFTAILFKIRKYFKFVHEDFNVFGSGRNTRLRTINDILLEIQNIKKKYKYVLKVDLINFFPTINRSSLIIKLEQMGIDSRLIKLIKKSFENEIYIISDSKKYRKDFPASNSKKGIPQGCAYSPLLANFYALNLDSCLKGKGFVSYRYLDDLIIFIDSIPEGKNIFRHLEKVAKDLGLSMHPISQIEKKTYIENTNQPIEYLGIEICNNNELKIPKTKQDKFLKHIITDLCNAKTFSEFGHKKVCRALKMYISGWKRYYKTNCIKHYDDVSKIINSKLKEHYETIEINDFSKHLLDDKSYYL